MRVDLDTGKYNVVIDSSNFDVSISDGGKLDVNIGESARIDVNSAVTYIKSGKKEIDTYVDGEVKPDILEYSKVESQKFIDAYVGSTVEEYVEEVTKPSINEYTDAKINQYNQNTVSKTDDFNTLAESLTNEYTSLAQTSEETLIQYVDSASLSAKSAKDSADVSTAQASISTAQAVISTTKASESLASANASSNSAISSENSAKASAKSLSDAEQVLANTIAQKDIAVSSANSAKESETKAKASETNAKTSETNAKSSELSAKTSETNAKTSETNASQSATKSAQSEANALSYSQNAKSSSDSASNSVVECQAIKDSLGTVYTFKGSVATVSALPSGASVGDVYDVTESGNNFAWTGSSWDSLGVNVDLSNYALKSDLNSKQDKLTAGTGISIDNNVISNTQTSAEWGNIQGTLSNQTDLQNALNNKQNTLVSGTNIKTVNGESVLGSGDLEIVGGVSYEDLNEDVSVNPAPIEAEWQAFKDSINATIGGYQEQVNSLQAQLNTTTSELNSTKSELATTKSSLNTVTTELNTVKKVRYVTEKYSSGTEWYTVYSDGWVEQGGSCNATQYNTTTVNVTFKIKMKDTNYYANACANTPDHRVAWAVTTRCAVKTTTGMCVHGAINVEGAYTGACSWEVKGYKA